MKSRNFFKRLVLSGLALAASSMILTACDSNSGGGGIGTDNPKLSEEVSAEDYLSGKKFCKFYETLTYYDARDRKTKTIEVTKIELGRRIQVPKDYSNPEGAKFEIYAWTTRPFNPDWPTLVIVDGGPGQNTHRSWDKDVVDFFSTGWNEIHFDQRGLGCSAPATFAEYKDAKSFSTEHIIKDMEMIRQAFGVEQWSVYGISYGTVPGTRYAHTYPERTRALVLEGVAYDGDHIHEAQWKADKANQVIASLSPEQQKGFHKLMNRDDFFAWMFSQVWSVGNFENGFRSLSEDLKFIIQDESHFNERAIAELLKAGPKDPNRRYPQYPGEVDRQIHRVIYCKELKGSEPRSYPWYESSQKKFRVLEISDSSQKKDCESRGVYPRDYDPYQAQNFPVSAPLTYFQGSHDGATMASGALLHWQKVPRGLVNFLLNQKGGHNPYLSDLFSRDESLTSLTPVALAQQKVLAKGFEGGDIPQSLVDAVNSAYRTLRPAASPNQKWLLFHEAPANLRPIEDEMEGIFRGRFRLELLEP